MPILEPAPCYRRFAEFDTSIRGVAHLLSSFAVINVLDCRDSPRLKAELFRRCDAALAGVRHGTLGIMPGTTAAPFEYEDEPIDKWAAFSVLAERNPKQTIRADCDCFSPMWAAYFHLRGIRAGTAVSQPRVRSCCRGPACKRGRLCGHGMAHAYTLVNEGRGPEVVDGSVMAGMNEPEQEFYGSGEHWAIWIPQGV